MPTTNHLGWCVEVYDKRIGWIRESRVYATKLGALLELKVSNRNSGYERRIYEVLQ